MFSRLKELVSNFVADRAGNVVLIVAFSAIPLVGMVGFATDYGLMLAVKAKLDHAADAAALAGITSAQTYVTSYTGSGTPTSAAITAGETQALAQFDANTGTLPNGTLTISSNTISASGLTLTGTFGYSYSMPTVFMQVLGTKTVTLSGSSSTSLGMAGYTNIYVVIDTSSSMGIGATTADQQIVYNKTGGCAVGCHYDGSDTVAEAAGATLRIDVAKQAVTTALNQIISSGQSAQYKVAIYTLSNTLTSVYALSSNISGAVTAVGNITLDGLNKEGGTDTTYALSQLNALLPTPGAGLTQATAQGTVMLITDGVQDSDWKTGSAGNWSDGYDSNFTPYSPCVNATCEELTGFAVPIYVEAFNPANCSPIKTKGYTMMTLNVQYIVPPTNLQSSSTVLNDVFTYINTYLISSISTNMTSCATSASNAYSADTPAQINAAVATMFASAAVKARITQ